MNTTHFSKDVNEFLLLLEREEVQYLIVGGEAVIYYGHVRLTGDIDILYSNTRSNNKKLFTILLEFWDNDIPGINNQEELSEEGMIIQFGLPPNRIDLINDITGVSFGEAWEKRVTDEIHYENETINVHYIGKEDLKKNKKATGRAKDQDDLNFL